MSYWRDQRLLLMASIVLSTASGLLSLPIMARHFTVNELAQATILLFVNSLFGVVDVMRPVYVSQCGTTTGIVRLSPYEIFVPTGLVGALVSAGTIVICSLLLSTYFSLSDSIGVGLAVLAYLLYTGLWALLEMNGLVGLSALIRGTSTSVLYILFAGIAWTRLNVELPHALLLVQLLTWAAFLFVARQFISSVRAVDMLNISFFNKCLSTMWQNAAKVIIDFADRIVVANLMDASAVASYNISYDLASRSNMPTQLVTTYYYPQLCRNRAALNGFLLKGIGLSGAIVTTGLLLWVFGQGLLRQYGGDKLAQSHGLFCAMIIIFSVYTLAFFAQTALRSLQRYRQLSVLFAIPALLGLVLMYPLLVTWGLRGMLWAVLVMRLPGVIGFVTLRKELCSYWVPFIVLVTLQTGAFAWVVYQGISS